jgi:hypothetical protein
MRSGSAARGVGGTAVVLRSAQPTWSSRSGTDDHSAGTPSTTAVSRATAAVVVVPRRRCPRLRPVRTVPSRPGGATGSEAASTGRAASRSPSACTGVTSTSMTSSSRQPLTAQPARRA